MIFTFESMAGFRPRVPVTLLAVVGVIAALEIGLRQVSDDWLVPYRSRLGFYHFFEREVIPKLTEPRVIVMGTSRAADAVIPKKLDELLGLPENSTMNLGLRGGRTFDALQFYRRNRSTLKKAKLIILNVDEWNFSSGFGIEWRYSLMSPWSERWAMPQPVELPVIPGEVPEKTTFREERKKELLAGLRNRLILDGIFNIRLRLRYLPDAVGKMIKDRKTKVLIDENNQVRTSSKDVGEPKNDPRQYDKLIHEFYEDFDTHPILVGHLEELVRLTKEDGVKLVLIQIPNRAAYQAAVEELHGPEFRQHVRVLKDLAKRLDVPLYFMPVATECGLDETSFEDYGHMAFKGAKEFTAFIAKMIEKEHLLAR